MMITLIQPRMLQTQAENSAAYDMKSSLFWLQEDM